MGREELSLKLLDHCEVTVALLEPRSRHFKVTRVGKTIGTNRAQIRQREVPIEDFQHISSSARGLGAVLGISVLPTAINWPVLVQGHSESDAALHNCNLPWRHFHAAKLCRDQQGACILGQDGGTVAACDSFVTVLGQDGGTGASCLPLRAGCGHCQWSQCWRRQQPERDQGPVAANSRDTYGRKGRRGCTLLWNDKEVTVGVAQAAILHVLSASVDVHRTAILGGAAARTAYGD